MPKKRPLHQYTWADYEAAKSALSPNLTPSQYEAEIRRIKKEMGL